jgi:hypothetical protein
MASWAIHNGADPDLYVKNNKTSKTKVKKGKKINLIF